MSIKDMIQWGKNKKEKGNAVEKADSSIHSLQRDMNRLFDEFWRGGSLFSSSWLNEDFGKLSLKTDVSETNNEVNISVELPGVEEKNIDLSLNRGMLTIKGEKKEEKEEKNGTVYTMERSYGSFHRSIPVPEGVDESKVEASFKNGVLKIRLPKTMEAKLAVKKIPVKAA